MSKSNQHYEDLPATIQVIGCIYENPNLLGMEEKYFFRKEDFTNNFHKLLFGSIYNLYQNGVQQITPQLIEDYLENKPKQLAIYKANKGDEYLEQLKTVTQYSAFDYYYQRMKKFTLLRQYDNIGLDCSCWYDTENITDTKLKEKQEKWLDNTPLEDIADIIDKKVSDIRLNFVDDNKGEIIEAGKNGIEMLEKLKRTPAYGYPFFDPIMNTITRGARRGKFYLRSAPTGVAKTRMMIADACSFACGKLFNKSTGAWEDNGSQEPTLYISTEQTYDEIFTMMIAFIAEVNEDHILTNAYEEGEWDRVVEANKVLEKSPLYIKTMPDFTLKDIESTIRKEVRDHNVAYVCHDYLHSSVSILSEIGGRTGVKGLREDNILFLISVKLKDIATEYGVFIMSSTQLNGSYKDATIYDENLLRGAKAIADKIDIGMHMFNVTKDDLTLLSSIKKRTEPNMKIAVYKNRQNKYKDVLLWVNADKGCCRFEILFATDYNYELLPIKPTDIYITPKMLASAF